MQYKNQNIMNISTSNKTNKQIKFELNKIDLIS